MTGALICTLGLLRIVVNERDWVGWAQLLIGAAGVGAVVAVTVLTAGRTR
jgi:hypothetical protein